MAARFSRAQPRALGLALFGVVGLSACSQNLEIRDYGDPTSLSEETEESGLVAWVLEPRLGTTLETATPEFVIGAYTQAAPYAPLRVLVGRLEKDATGTDQAVDLRPASAEGEPGPKQRFKLAVPLTHGENRLLIRVETEDQTRVRRLVYALTYTGAAPGLSLSLASPSAESLGDDAPCDVTEPLREALTSKEIVCIRGQTTAKDGAKMEIAIGLTGAAKQTPKIDENGGFSLAVSLLKDSDNTIETVVTDERGLRTEAQHVVVQDSKPPALFVTSNARETTAASLEIEGSAQDAHGIAHVEVRGRDGSVIKLGSASPFKALVRLVQGENPVTLVAYDRAGNEAREELLLSRVRTLWLSPAKTDAGGTDLELDRFNLEELLDEQAQKDLSIVEVPLKPSIKQALLRIREPERYGVDTSAWGPPERNLQRILNMTPDNADLSGTSMEDLLGLANAVGLPSARILSQLLDVGITEFILDADVAAEVMTEKLVGSHPNIARDANGEYAIDVSLYDVLQNLGTLATRFGPSGGHPGFLTGQSYSEVLESGFMMTLPVHSNLVQYDAVDLTRASKDFFFLLKGENVLHFDVLNDDFSVVGLKDEPTVDLRIQVREHPGASMLKGGTSKTASPDADNVGFYRGNGQGYGVSPWFFEHSAVEIGYRMLAQKYAAKNYKHELRYDAGSIKDAAVITWDRGWVDITTAGGIGNAPPPIYAWDILMEVAQVRLHDNGVPEGQAEMAFTLDNLSIGLTATELVEKLRPKLHEQETELSEFFVGDLGLAESKAELFYMAAAGKAGALAFRAKDDAEGDFPYAKPGFFSDAQLTNKVSVTTPVGGVDDETHEKVPATLGASYFASDESGQAFEITIAERDGDRIGVRVKPGKGVTQ